MQKVYNNIYICSDRGVLLLSPQRRLMKKTFFEKSFFKSRIFKKLLSSYIFVISALFLIYTTVMLVDTKMACSEKKEQF